MSLIAKSISIIESSQDPSGAFPASPRYETYRYSWLRDNSFVSYALCRWNRFDSARRWLLWTGRSIKAQTERLALLKGSIEQGHVPAQSDYLPARYHLDGTVVEDNWPSFQIDGYGAWLWAAAEYVEMSGEREFLAEIKEAVGITLDYLSLVWPLPNYDCWEENGDGIHPSSLACIYGGASRIAKLSAGGKSAELAGRVKIYLDRILAEETIIPKKLGSDLVDASSLWLVLPFGLLETDDPRVRQTVVYIEQKLLRDYGVKRYYGDSYYGGGSWIILSAWLGWYYHAVGRTADAGKILDWIEAQANEAGELPEQVSEYLYKPEAVNEWRGRWGNSAVPLLWSHAMYLVLASEIGVKPVSSEEGPEKI